MSQRVNRIPPNLPTHLYKTYAVRSPLSTHYRAATCAEVDCEAFKNGWQLRVENLTKDLLYTAKHSGRRYQEVSIREGETYLVFEAGQVCFASTTHRISLEREEFFFTGQGDFRSFSTKRAKQFDKPENFVDSFATHLDCLKSDIEKG